MRRKMGIAMAACGGITAIVALAGAAGGAGLQLFDAPRGAWLAEVRADAPIAVVEERDGWRRIRIEGWVPAGAVDGPAATGEVAAAPEGPVTGGAPAADAVPAAAIVATRPPGARIEGVLMPARGMVPATVGANLVVLLIADVEKYDAERQGLETTCQSRIGAQDQAMQDAQALVNTAFNSTNNFTQASQRYDRAKADLAAAKKGRAEAVRTCLEQADALAERFTVTRAPSDSSGRFEFAGLGPGSYRIFASDHRDGVDRAWAFDAATTPGATVVLDPLAAVAPDPYRGLR